MTLFASTGCSTRKGAASAWRAPIVRDRFDAFIAAHGWRAGRPAADPLLRDDRTSRRWRAPVTARLRRWLRRASSRSTSSSGWRKTAASSCSTAAASTREDVGAGCRWRTCRRGLRADRPRHRGLRADYITRSGARRRARQPTDSRAPGGQGAGYNRSTIAGFRMFSGSKAALDARNQLDRARRARPIRKSIFVAGASRLAVQVPSIRRARATMRPFSRSLLDLPGWPGATRNRGSESCRRRRGPRIGAGSAARLGFADRLADALASREIARRRRVQLREPGFSCRQAK